MANIKQQFRCMSTRLEEVGKIEMLKTQGEYEAGQLFLHRVFGYRGVVLFPWVARLFDRDSCSKDPLYTPLSSTGRKDKTNYKSGSHNKLNEDVTYYQALIDQRDVPHIRAQPEAVFFLGNERDFTLYAVLGLDYVNHEDLLPYISCSNKPIHHELFEKFLTPDLTKIPQLMARESLDVWHKTNYKWLELSAVYRETTEGIRVTVIPFFLGVKGGTEANRDQQKEYFWRYCIRLENFTQECVQLRKRHWRIYNDSSTTPAHIRRPGVAGQEPILSLEEPAFQYSSVVSLLTSSGSMWGTFKMERNDGSLFDVCIPHFSLESKGS